MEEQKTISNKTLVLIDDANMYYASRKAGWGIDYKKFYDWLHQNFSILDVYFFGGVITKKAFFDRHPNHTIQGFLKEKRDREKFFKFLSAVGYKVKPKPVSSLYDSTEGDFKRKCNVDVEITIIALDLINVYQELILCSGDGDFEKLLRYVKGKHKKATVIAFKARSSNQLQLVANRFIPFEGIRQEVQKQEVQK